MTEKQKSLADYNEGDTFLGEVITKLYSAKSDFLIFEGDNCGEVTIHTNSNELRKRCSQIGTKISLITAYLITKREKKKFVDQIGLAYSEALEGNVAEAQKICDKTIERIELYKSNIGRLYYLLSCLSIVIISIVISYFLKKYNFIPEITPHFFIMTYASIGGFLSIAKNLKKIQVDSSDFGWFQFIYGGIRILISMFSGLIIFVLIKSEFILPKLYEQDNIYIFYLIAIVAGFSESLIPDLLKKIENEKIIK